MKKIMSSLSLICVGLFLISLTFIGESNAGVADKAVGMWLFDDGGGDTAKDSSGNGNDGTLVSDPEWVDGKFGGALKFDGAATLVDCGNGASLDFAGEQNFSISAWVRSDIQNIAEGMIVWKALGCSSWAQYGFGVGNIEAVGSPANKLSFYYRTANNDTKEIVVDEDDFPADEWVHVAGTYDGNQLKLYMNGSLVATQDSSDVPWASTENVYIGADPGCGIRYVWSGVLDEVLIFNVTLTDSDVKKLATLGATGAAVEPGGKLSKTWARIKCRN